MARRAAVAAILAGLGVSCAHAAGDRGACGRGLFVVDGACLGPREIDAFCGARSIRSACVVPTCDRDDATATAPDGCVSQRAARAALEEERPSSIPEGTKLACRDDHVLVADADHVVCLEQGVLCPRTTHFDRASAAPRGCAPDPPCPPGAVRGGATCVPVTLGRTVDVGAWARAVLGDDGGAGDDRVCRPLSRAPWALDVGPGSSRNVTLTIDLRFPNNDVTSALAAVRLDGPPASARAAQEALEPLLFPLRALGGTTNAASVTVRITCLVQGGSTPLLLPP